MSGVAGGAIGLAVGSFFGPVLDPALRGLGYASNALNPTLIPHPNELLDMYHRSAISYDAFYELMSNHGYNADNAKLMYYASDALVTGEQATNLKIHDTLNLLYHYETNNITGDISANHQTRTNNNYLIRTRRQGYRESEAEDLFNANRPMPTFSTILDWMAKEVFEPDKISKFELDAEQPDELARYMSAYGVPTEEARKYWIAHWATIGRAGWDEMYQRFRSDRNTADYSDIDMDELREAGITDFADVEITPTDYDDYYTILELSPYFRNRGKGSVYNPLPFTVLQQLWQYGVLTYTQMVGRLRDYGYSKRSSELIMKAWERKFPYGYREPLSDNIIRKYELRKISKADATTELTTAGVTTDAITFLLDKVDDEIELKQEQYYLKSLEKRAYQESMTKAEIDTVIDTKFPDWTDDRRDFETKNIMEKVGQAWRRINLRLAGKAFGEGGITETEFRSYMTSRFIPTSDQDIAVSAYSP